MALFRQGSGPHPGGTSSGNDHRPGSPFRLQDHVKADQTSYLGLSRSRSIKKRPGRLVRNRKCSIGAIATILMMVVVVTIFSAGSVFPLMRSLKGDVRVLSSSDLPNQEKLGSSSKNTLNQVEEEDIVRDSKYWDSVGQSADSEHEDDLEILADEDKADGQITNSLEVDTEPRRTRTVSSGNHEDLDRKENLLDLGKRYDKNFHSSSQDETITTENLKNNLFGESDRVWDSRLKSGNAELIFNQKETSLLKPRRSDGEKLQAIDGEDSVNDSEQIETDVSVDNIVDMNLELDPEGSSRSDSDISVAGNGEDPRLVDFLREAQLYSRKTDPTLNLNSDDEEETFLTSTLKGSSQTEGNFTEVESLVKKSSDQVDETQEYDNSHVEDEEEEAAQTEQQIGKARKKKRRAPPCEISFLNSTESLREPTDNTRFASFSLSYRQTEVKPEDDESWEAKFGGHQTFQEREDSFVAKDQHDLHCGFVEGTGFDVSEEDRDYLQTCHIAVSSCIFGNYDHIRTPSGKKITSASKKKVCFAMFVDQASLDGMIDEGEVPDEKMYVGLWRIILLKNLPYSDNRRNGKIPKFLTHRLFPNARYSIWLDSKLRLSSDPLLMLEYFLWRGHYEYAISNHYDRHCVWEEVEQNKKLNKYNHSVIDEQFAFYQADGLVRFNASSSNKLLPSHVPEGSLIIRAHTPASNLFSCLWFNEVDRFTSRDQLSFAYTWLKVVRSNHRFRLNMFKDCERKAIAKLYRHKSEDFLIKDRKH